MSSRIFVFIAALLACLTISLSAQVASEGIPYSSTSTLPDEIPVMTMPGVDLPALQREDEIEAAEGLPYRFGVPFDVEYDMETSGRWDTLPNGDKVWRLKIVCPGAYTINLLYSNYWLPEGAKFYIYNENKTEILGAFTSLNNKDHGEFATGLLRGDVCILEYNEPSFVTQKGAITVSRVVHGYKDILADFGDSGSCNNNVHCPEGDPWADQIRAVAMILTGGGFRICSGSLVNNVNQDLTQYFLTANHCLGGENSWIFMFNYESPNCSNINGPTNQTVSGSTLLATRTESDFALLLLSEQIPESYNVYFAGWSNINVASPNAVGIHHPSGDIKKISFQNDPLISADYLQDTGTTHWKIDNWEDGTTEGGSSGSPLYDNNHRVVGQLHGGYASCTSITPDWYGKFSLSWNGGSTPSTRLRDWLDPQNTGATTLDGRDMTSYIDFNYPNGLPDIISPSGGTTIRVEVLPVDQNPQSGTGMLHYDGGSGWVAVAMNEVSANVYDAIFPAFSCGTEVHYYFSAFTDQGVEVTDPAGAPTGYFVTTSATGVIEAYNNDLSTNPGWTTQDLWSWGHPTGGGGQYGNPDPTNGHTGSFVYGYNLSGDYQNNLPERHLTSGAIDCSNITSTHLKFWRWLGVEQPLYDHAYVRISTNGTSWTTIWQNAGEITDAAWNYIDLDISSIADNQPTVYLRWTMGTTDGSWQFCGWNIDDIVVSGIGCDQQVTGSCCYDDGSCAVVNGSAECLSGGGTYQGDGTVCLGDGNGNSVDDACEGLWPVGACCFGDGSCQLLTQAACLSGAGEFKGDGTQCLGDNNSNGIDDACEPAPLVPTLSEWGMILMGLLLTVFLTVAIVRRRNIATSHEELS